MPPPAARVGKVANEKDIRLLAPEMIENLEGEHCVEKQSGDPLTILLGVASSHPDKAVQFLKILFVATQDEHHRQQALEALGKVSKASPGMFSECFPFLYTASKAGDNDVRLLALKTLGEIEWKHYFGEVEPAPDLPRDIATILDSECPFWPGKKIKDTHLLALIPAAVDEMPFTLNSLGELIQRPKNGRREMHYVYYPSDVKAQIGAISSKKSYWLLMTRDVLPESRNKTYAAQEALVSAHANRTGLPYEVPKALEVVTAILTHYVRDGERLYSSNKTRCQELISWGSDNYSSIVGGFDFSGLDVYDDGSFCSYDDEITGVAGCWKF